MAIKGSLPIANPLSLWGTVLAGAQQGLDSQAMYAAINAQLESSGTRYGQATLGQVAQMWGQAKAMTVASNNLAAAPDEYAITGQMIGVVPYGRTASGQFGAPRYQARTLYTVMENGKEVTRSFISKDIDPEAMTVGDLRGEIESDVTDAADQYEGGLVGIVSISIEQL